MGRHLQGCKVAIAIAIASPGGNWRVYFKVAQISAAQFRRRLAELSCKTDAGIFDETSSDASCCYLVALSSRHSTNARTITTLLSRYDQPLHNISLKMNRHLAASLLVALVAILSTAPIDAASESVLANDPTRGQETFLERRLKVCAGNALRAPLATRIDIDVVGCLAPCPGGVVSKHTAVLFSRRVPFLDSHQFVSFRFPSASKRTPIPVLQERQDTEDDEGSKVAEVDEGTNGGQDQGSKGTYYLAST